MGWIEQFGFLAFFLAGLLEFLGVPFPGAPVLMAGGVLSGTGLLPSPHHWLAATAGAAIADQIWYWLSRGRGEVSIRTACRVSVNPTACVCRANEVLDRFGASALLVAKFIPGVSNVATPLAAVSGIRPGRFTIYSVVGSALWAGVWLAIGSAFRSTLRPLVEAVFTWAPRAIGILVALGLILLAIKVAAGWWAVRTDPHPEGAHPQNPFELGASDSAPAEPGRGAPDAGPA